MEISFPKDEYRNYDKQLSLMDNPAYRIYVMPDMETDDIKAFIAVWEFETIVYIEHFAVNPDHRNNGLGSKILCEIIKIVNKTICLEVELPENELAVRRIGFYERNDSLAARPIWFRRPDIWKRSATAEARLTLPSWFCCNTMAAPACSRRRAFLS